MRTIRDEARYTEQINILKIEWARLDNALSDMQTALIRIPEQFPVVPGSDPPISRLRIAGYPGVPPLSIFFTYTDTEVHFLSAEIIEQD
jgi:hypothetical protein